MYRWLLLGPVFSHQYCRSSSNSVLLPASPKICHGREREIDMVTSVLLREDPSRVAILGPGGIGKSTLATSVLHHPDIVSMFGKNRHFLTCEAAKTPSELAALFAAYFGLKNEGNTIKNIVRHVSNIMAPLVMVLDNLDSCWEPLESRNQVEEFLSLLTDVPTFNLIVRVLRMYFCLTDRSSLSGYSQRGRETESSSMVSAVPTSS